MHNLTFVLTFHLWRFALATSRSLMPALSAFLDTSVLLTMFAKVRNGDPEQFVLNTEGLKKLTFEKCVFECFLAFRGIGGKKPDEGRGDWATRFLRLEGDPKPLSEAAGKLHSGSINAAHYWTGQADESQWMLPESFEEYMADVKKHVHQEEWDQAAEIWGNLQNIFGNHRCYLKLFSDFKIFLTDHDISVISHEDLYTKERQSCRQMTMEGLSQRSTIPNEDFEIIVAALLTEPHLFISADQRLLTATTSIEANLRRCDFVHLRNVQTYMQSHCMS